ncbi:MAG TPA: DUF2271 domain-containing protein [Rhodobacteraceae bacterium]|jgi:hypothetical protein|nr:DUF2271 domain-containing protein [Paracoccaceae bacterium]
MTISLSGIRNVAAAIGVSTLALFAAEPALAKKAIVLVQLNAYEGDEAYFSLYLVNPEGRYEKTLWVSGPDEEWYPDLQRWWRYLSRAPQELDAITGASTAGGDRSIIHLDLDESLIDAGYSLRVETSVEDQDNHFEDAQVELTTDGQRARTAGMGYVRYIRYKF